MDSELRDYVQMDQMLPIGSISEFKSNRANYPAQSLNWINLNRFTDQSRTKSNSLHTRHIRLSV